MRSPFSPSSTGSTGNKRSFGWSVGKVGRCSLSPPEGVLSVLLSRMKYVLATGEGRHSLPSWRRTHWCKMADNACSFIGLLHPGGVLFWKPLFIPPHALFCLSICIAHLSHLHKDYLLVNHRGTRVRNIKMMDKGYKSAGASDLLGSI